MVDELIRAAGSDQLLMAEVTADTVQIGVLKDGQASTWAYRDGTVGKVIGDLTYVNQATFDIDRFNIDNVAALFDAAAAVAGSSQSQSLNIVDNAGGDVVMSVATVPESKTVFFNPDGSLLRLLDFDEVDGLRTGLIEALGIRTLVHSITISSTQGVQVVCPGGTDRLVHRSRGLGVPVATVTIPGIAETTKGYGVPGHRCGSHGDLAGRAQPARRREGAHGRRLEGRHRRPRRPRHGPDALQRGNREHHDDAGRHHR